MKKRFLVLVHSTPKREIIAREMTPKQELLQIQSVAGIYNVDPAAVKVVEDKRLARVKNGEALAALRGEMKG